jgi:hypothetical protein
MQFSKLIAGWDRTDQKSLINLIKKSTVKRGYSGQRGYSGHFLFNFYFELKDIFEQSKCPQLLVTYPRMYQK